MTHTKANKSKILALILGLTMCLALILGIVFFHPQTAHAETTEIETLAVAFKKLNVGNSLASAFEFEDETERTLKVPTGANYTATLVFVSKNGQATTLWEKDSASFSWSRVENQLIEQKVAYCIRVRFAPKKNYKLSKDADVLKSHMKVTGAELGKGKDIELWDSAGQNSVTTEIEMDFLISRGMTYVGYPRYISPRINEKVSGKIATEYTDTGIWLSGAPAPYTYEAKIAPIGMEIQTTTVFDKSYCYYQIIAKNAMDGGTMYITATAADRQTCDIPVTIAAVSGGHEHTWVEKIEKIDFEHHGYTKCTDPDCPGVAPAFDKGSHYASHEFNGGCTASCTRCGNLGNPDAKHNFSAVASDDDANCHVFKCVCGEFEKDASGNVKKEVHSGGEQTCLNGAQCDVCGKEYLAATGHKYEFKSFGNGDGTYTHLGFCKYCKEENTSLRHSPQGGGATCQKKATCTYKDSNGDVCGLEHGDFLPHNFVDGICTGCGSDKYIREVLIDVPEFYKGMAYEAMFYPTVIKGNVIDLGIYYHIASFSRDGNGYLSGPHNFKTTFITENSVMIYSFRPQSNCVFPDNIDDLSVNVTRGEVLSKKIRSGDLVVLVLLRLDSVVQSVDIDFSQPLTGNPAEMLNVTEKNGLEFIINSIAPLKDGKIIENTPIEINITIKAPTGKLFQSQVDGLTVDNWLCDVKIPSGSRILTQTLSTDLKELNLIVQTSRPIDCPHETVVLEAGRPTTCTEDGIKDKYVCAGCGAAFFDAARTQVWYDAIATLPKGHLCVRHDATPCSDGRDGNIVYFECQREECGKLFADAACSSEITLEQTIIHDFKTEWSSSKDKHYHECKNCTVIKDEAAHRPDRTEATEDDPVKCLDCGYKIEPALAHTTHHTTLVPGEDATCMKEGKKPYYRCDGCEVKFEDESATKPIADESSLVIAKTHKFGAWVPEVPATEETEGVKGHKDCDFCGKHFDENGAEIADLTIAKLVKAEVTVVGGTGGGTYTQGESVTVTAEDKEGKVFKGWQDESGKIVSTEKDYTFKVEGEKTLTAVYEDAPVAKKGLSGGAIAGIVIGSVLLAGIGGFAVLWFAVKKKTFADLGAILKKGFTAIGNFFKNLGAKIKALFTKKK
ncbi:MAG: hypothetical protein PUH99_00355 [Firmicutes bacterium]|nr:hypothetical protein [Bacillota bacterium]MDY5530964.1 hypothetical protein [Pumilibacteraceae bacterium]